MIFLSFNMGNPILHSCSTEVKRPPILRTYRRKALFDRRKGVPYRRTSCTIQGCSLKMKLIARKNKKYGSTYPRCNFCNQRISILTCGGLAAISFQLMEMKHTQFRKLPRTFLCLSQHEPFNGFHKCI